MKLPVKSFNISVTVSWTTNKMMFILFLSVRDTYRYRHRGTEMKEVAPN